MADRVQIGSSSRNKDRNLKIGKLEGIQIGTSPLPTPDGTGFETISQLAERRRIQNRIAQRNYRKNLKKRLEELERRASEGTDVEQELVHMEDAMALNELDDQQLDRDLEEPSHSRFDRTFTGMDLEEGHIDIQNESICGPSSLLARPSSANVYSNPYYIISLPKSLTEANTVEDATSIIRDSEESAQAVNKDISSLYAYQRSPVKSKDTHIPTSKSQTASSLIKVGNFSASNEKSPALTHDQTFVSCMTCIFKMVKCDRGRPICSNCLKAGSLKLCRYQTGSSQRSTYRTKNHVNDEESENAQRIKTLKETINVGRIDRETSEKMVLEGVRRASTPATSNQSHTGLQANTSHPPVVELEPGVLMIDGQISIFKGLQERETQDRPVSRDQPADPVAPSSSGWPIIALADNKPTWRQHEAARAVGQSPTAELVATSSSRLRHMFDSAGNKPTWLEREAAKAASQPLPAAAESLNASLATKTALTLVSPLRKESLASLDEVHKPTEANRGYTGLIKRATRWVNDQRGFQLQENVGVEIDDMESEHKSKSGSQVEKKVSAINDDEFENLPEYASTINTTDDAISTFAPPSLINTSAYETSAQSGVSTPTLREAMPSWAYHKEHPRLAQTGSERSGKSTPTLKDTAYGKSRRTLSPFNMEGESDIDDTASHPSTLKLSTAVQSRYVRTPEDVESPYHQMRRLSVKAAELITQPGQRKSPSSGRATSTTPPARSHDHSLQRDQLTRHTQPGSSASHTGRFQTTPNDEYEVDDGVILKINPDHDSSSDSSSDIYSSFSHLKATDSEMMEAYHHELQGAPTITITNHCQLGATQDTGFETIEFTALPTNMPPEFFASIDPEVVLDMSEPDQEATNTEYPPSFWRAVKTWRSKASQSGTSVTTGVEYETDDTDYTEGSSQGHAIKKYKKRTWALQASNMPALAEESSDDDCLEQKKENLAGKDRVAIESLAVEPFSPLQEPGKEASVKGSHTDLRFSQWDPHADEAGIISDDLQLEPAHLFPDLTSPDWKDLQTQLPDSWMWDVDHHSTTSLTDAPSPGCWTCTPLNDDDPKSFPLTIAGAPVILPVEYTWPPMAGVNPPPDPRPSAPIDCTAEVPLEVIRDLFLTFEGSLGFYLLVNGVLQILVGEEFNKEWASSHLPHKYGGLKVCYIAKNMEPTMLPSTATMSTKTDTMKSKSSQVSTAQSSISGLSSSSSFFRPSSKTTTGLLPPPLQLNDFIEARTKSSHRKEKFAGRIGAKVVKDGEPYLVMSSHVVTEAILAKSHRAALFGRNKDRFEKLDGDWNEHVEIWAGNEKIGTIDKSFDPGAEIYPDGFRHDTMLIKPSNLAAIKDIQSPIPDIGWLSRESWNSLRQQSSAVKILGNTENHRAAKTLKTNRPSEVLVVGEGIFLSLASSKPTKDHDVSTWKDLVSRALLYRVYPDFDPPNGYSGIALYVDGMREDGTEGPGVVGFQSFVQRSGHVQNFEMEGGALEKRLKLGRVAFYGAFQVPDALRREYEVV